MCGSSEFGFVRSKGVIPRPKGTTMGEVFARQIGGRFGAALGSSIDEFTGDHNEDDKVVPPPPRPHDDERIKAGKS